MASDIRIRDSLRRETVDLTTRDAGKVSIYACGPTVYSRIHVGNARPFVVFMLFKRLLEHDGYDTTLVINVTDVNDKIYIAAERAGVPSQQLAHEMTTAYFGDTNRLGLGRPDHEPLATETIGEIVTLIESLIERGHAYEAGGDVYFAVRSFPDYGKLSNRRVDEMELGEQGEPDDDTQLKRDPLDFALWKAQKPGEDTAWDSPWGKGRPGWHIECSAMAEKLLGLDFDVHGGGIDLLFPHHENELAQTEAASGKPLARTWMHNGMIQFGAEKMAKSVGNIKLLHEALDEAGRDALILYFLTGRYHQPLAFTDQSLTQAQASVERIRNGARALADVTPGELDGQSASLLDKFFGALRDDFNTPVAIAALFELVGLSNSESIDSASARAALEEMLPVLGLENLLEADEAVEAHAQQLAEEREQARKDKDFARADEIRGELSARGYEIRDTADGPIVVRSSS